jgi:hypothetical protein
MISCEVKASVLITWGIVSVVILMILLMPFLLSPNTIKEIVPLCEWKVKYNRSCPLCGMTTSFIMISLGDFAGAVNSNSFSLWLYNLFLFNEIIFALCLNQYRRRWHYLVKSSFSG